MSEIFFFFSLIFRFNFINKKKVESQEPVLCSIKKSVQETASSHKRKQAEAAHRLEFTGAAICINGVSERPRHSRVSEAGECSYCSSTTVVNAAKQRATPEYPYTALTDDDPTATGVPFGLYADDDYSTVLPPMYLPAAAPPEGQAPDPRDLVCTSPLVNQRQHLGKGPGMMTADAFNARENCHNSTILDYADSITLTEEDPAVDGIRTCAYDADYNTEPLPTVASSKGMMTTPSILFAAARFG